MKNAAKRIDTNLMSPYAGVIFGNTEGYCPMLFNDFVAQTRKGRRAWVTDNPALAAEIIDDIKLRIIKRGRDDLIQEVKANPEILTHIMWFQLLGFEVPFRPKKRQQERRSKFPPFWLTLQRHRVRRVALSDDPVKVEIFATIFADVRMALYNATNPEFGYEKTGSINSFADHSCYA